MKVNSECLFQVSEKNMVRLLLIVIDKESNNCQIIDFVVPYDTRVKSKETEKKKNEKSVFKDTIQFCLAIDTLHG